MADDLIDAEATMQADAALYPVEEPMDYTPITRGGVAAPDFPDEAWSDDDPPGPMGY